MIGLLIGTVFEIDQEHNKAIVLVNNVGYIVLINSNTASSLQINEEVKLFIAPEIREDAFDLFGFLSDSERNFYKKLRSVNGVGPKTALNILNLELDNLCQAIANEDLKTLCTVPGLGKKTAERLILELNGSLPQKRDHKAISPIHCNNDIITALESLGYKKPEIIKILQTVPPEIVNDQDIIKFFLQQQRR